MIPTISRECSQFLKESNGQCLIKKLPKEYQGFARVKVRISKGRTGLIENFNRAFKEETHELHQRSIFAYTNMQMVEESIDSPKLEPFYVFPIDGYKIMFNPAVQNLHTDYEDYDQLHIDGELVADQLKLSYYTGTLLEATKSNCEVIIYGIPYYYALRASLIDNYNTFFNNKTEI